MHEAMAVKALILGLVLLATAILLALWLWMRRSAEDDRDADQEDAPMRPMQIVRTAPDRVVVGDAGTGSVEITVIPDGGQLAPHTTLPVPSPTIAAVFEPLLAQAVKLVKAKSAANTYVLEFSPEVTKGLKDGIFEHVHTRNGATMAMVRGLDGKFAAQGTVRRAGMAPLVPVMFWQVLAEVTQQKFLADIDEKLGQLQTGLAALKDWLETEQLGRLQGDIQYLLDLRASLAGDGSATDAPCKEQLEGIVRDRYADIAAIKLRMEQLAARMAEHPPGNVLRPSTTPALGLISDMERLQRAFYLSVGGQVMAIQYQLATGASADLARRRLQRLKEEVRAHQEQGEKLRRLSRCLARGTGYRVSLLKFRRDRRDRIDPKVRGAAREAARCGRRLDAALVSGMRAASQNAGWLLGDYPVRVMLRTGEDGEVTQLALLHSSAN